MKKQTTLFLGNGITGNPADKDFVVDGLYAGLSLSVFDIQGTSPTIQVTATALYEDGFDLAYDGQGANNFTLGKTVKGKTSQATGVIVADADGGATGTLTLKRVQGTFFDNEDLVETDSFGTVRAQVNGQLVRRFVEADPPAAATGVWADTGAIGASGSAQFINPEAAAGDGDRGRVWPRRFRLKIVTGGTLFTSANIAVDLVQSEVK